MSLIAVLALPYGYYQLVRLIVCGCATYLAFKEWSAMPRPIAWGVLLAALAILFNPFVPLHFTRAIWRALDTGGAVVFAAHYLVRGR